MRKGFDDLVKKVWLQPVIGDSPIKRWNNKICKLRKFLRGWDKHIADMLKKEKERQRAIIGELDPIEEIRVLSAQEIELTSQSNELVAHMLWEEELKWYQQSNALFFILEGDSNTKYL